MDPTPPYKKAFNSDDLNRLARFVGGVAKLYCFGSPHNNLAIKLHGHATDEIVFLVLWECTKIHVEVYWAFSIPDVRDAGQDSIEVSDRKAGLSVTCGILSLHDDYDWYLGRKGSASP